MKRIFILPFFLFSCFVSFEQNRQDGFLFQPQIGFGASKMTGIDPQVSVCDCGLNITPQKPVVSIDAEVKLGYQYRSFHFNTGLQYICTGAMQNGQFTYFPSGVPRTSATQDNYSHYDHFIVPISVGLNIPVKKKWSITPEIGTRILFISQNDRSISNSRDFLFSGKLNIERQINDHFSVVITPSFYDMVSPLNYKTSFGDQPISLKAANTIFMLQGGVQWHFCHKGKNKAARKIGVAHK